MSWVETIQSNIKITTGDGKVYEPLYMITSKSVDYNIAEFEFPGIEGTLVKRGTPKGARYRFELMFQGDDHLDEMKDFEKSNIDRRPWEVLHPIYDALLLQPSSLKFDPTGLNVSVITGELIETIKDESPKITQNPEDKIGFDVQTAKILNAASFASIDPEPADITSLTLSTQSIFDVGASSVKSGDQSNEYLLKFNSAKSAISELLTDVSLAATEVNDLLIIPALFEDKIKNRLLTLRNQFESISSNLGFLNRKNQKLIYEMQAGAIINAAVLASVNPVDGDYTDIDSVLFVTDSIISLYNQFIANLDLLQTETGGAPGSFVPGFDSLSALSSVVNLAVSQLLSIAIESRQKRELILEHDSNILLLTHRFYGISPDQSTIDDFINQNKIGLNELLQVLKGRELIYYV